MELAPRRGQWRARRGPDGIHLFRRADGLNVLVEAQPPVATWSEAPRQVSVALTNACDLKCAYCYAPKRPARLETWELLGWLRELDGAGTFGVGFGGGEPTLHPEFTRICRETAGLTGLAVTFTTHAHHVTADFARALAGSVHFVRVSLDGVGATYERLRGRSFETLLAKIAIIREIAPVGLNVVVNEDTVGDLDAISVLADRLGIAEILLLPERRVPSRSGIDDVSSARMSAWVHGYAGPVRLTVSESGLHGLPVADPVPKEQGLRSYAHIDATGSLRPTSFSAVAVRIDYQGALAALRRLHSLTAGGEQ
jgi:pyruvate-formate lyase-activating enzyme